jgi:ribosomal protein S1
MATQGALMDFGAFVDIGMGSRDALLHISQLSVRPHVTLLHKLKLVAGDLY